MKHHQVHPTQPSPSLSQSFQLMHSCHLTVFDTVCLLAAHLLEVGRLTGCALALPPSLGFLWRVRKRDITVFSRRFPWQQELWIQPRPPHPPPCRVAPISDAGLPASAADAPCVLGNWHSILSHTCLYSLSLPFGQVSTQVPPPPSGLPDHPPISLYLLFLHHISSGTDPGLTFYY